jgi:hypothetical protein
LVVPIGCPDNIDRIIWHEDRDAVAQLHVIDDVGPEAALIGDLDALLAECLSEQDAGRVAIRFGQRVPGRVDRGADRGGGGAFSRREEEETGEGESELVSDHVPPT